MSGRVAALGHDLVKKPSPEGLSGVKGAINNNGTISKIVTPRPDNGINARYPVMSRIDAPTGWGHPTPGARSWLGSQVLTLSLGGTEIIQETGTVRCIDSEGGIFVIITGDGSRYLPSNLPTKYARDGLNVEFKAYKMPINPADRMWGSPVRIISITADPSKAGIIETTGTVTWVPLEGGFFGIIADDGTQYDPSNLPTKYARDGLRIRITAVEEPDAVSFHMWGTSITINEATPIGGNETHNGGVLVDYHRTGGIAGFDDHLTITGNGATVVTTRNVQKQYVLSSKELNDLVALFESTGFSSLNQQDLPMVKVTGNDFFVYSIEFRGHKLEAIEYAFPEKIDPLIERLNNLILRGMK
jgi:hypothetical protein